MVRSRYKQLMILLSAGAVCKNRDKQLTFIVRVIASDYLKFNMWVNF